MPIIPAGFGQATLVFSIPSPSSPANVTFGFQDIPASGADTLAESIWDAFVAAGSLITRLDANTVLTECRILRRTAGGELEAGVHVENRNGPIGGEGNPPQVALLVQKLTGLAGKRRRGRMYIPGATGVLETGAFSAAAQAANTAAANTFLSTLNTSTVDMYLLHSLVGDSPNAVTSLVANPLSATQRRRIR